MEVLRTKRSSKTLVDIDGVREADRLLDLRKKQIKDILDSLRIPIILKELYPEVEIAYEDSPTKITYELKTTPYPQHTSLGFIIINQPIISEVFSNVVLKPYVHEMSSIEAFLRRFGVRGTIADPKHNPKVVDLSVGYLDKPEAQIQVPYHHNGGEQQISYVKQLLTNLHPSMSL